MCVCVCGVKLVAHSGAAVLNMVVKRDKGHRLRLCASGTGAESSVQDCGEVHVTPVLEWRLLRAPQMTVKPASKMATLSHIGPDPSNNNTGVGDRPASPWGGYTITVGYRRIGRACTAVPVKLLAVFGEDKFIGEIYNH